ncbi:two-component regulator propeller domain-containing protein [Flavobacterium sp. ST-87]|uniref:histidine kinase n=1 Tax=Flavobacterium plantiphilum TaxID=3163297 RepID=A0ABW8XQ27_9FLAO
MKKKILLTLLYLIIENCLAQPVGVLKHFSHDVKLSQSNILEIQQDSKGFIWLGTYNGLIRYDGNNFQNFEVVQKGRLNLASNRVSSFKFDKKGRIWIKSEKKEVYYFDTATLSYHFPLEEKNNAFSKYFIVDYKVMPSGRVWLSSQNSSNLIVLEPNNEKRIILFNSSKLKGTRIQEIFEDAMGTTWFLTKYGICRLKKTEIHPEYMFFNMTGLSGKSYSINTVMELNDELWFGGTNGKLIRYSKTTSTFFDVQLRIDSNITKIKNVTAAKILIFTASLGIYYYDIKSGKSTIYNNKTVAGFPNGNINYMGITNERELWFDNSESGIYQFNLETKKVTHLHSDISDPTAAKVKRKTFFLTGADGTIWIQPNRESLSYWDQKQNKLLSISHCIKESIDEASDVMHATAFDNQGNLWFCSFRKGLDLIIFNNPVFSTLKSDLSKRKQNNNVRALMEDKKKNLWVASRSQKITIFDSDKKKIGYLGSDGTLSENSPGWGADIYAIFQDNSSRIWVGTRGNGLFCLIPTEKPFKFKVLHYTYNELNPFSISANDIYKIFQSASGKIYLATWGGGVNLVQETNQGIRFINYRNIWKNYPIKIADRVRSIVEDKYQHLFFVSSYNLFSFTEQNKISDKLEFKEFPQVSGNDILDILVTSDNKLLLGTNGKGIQVADLNRKRELNFQNFATENANFPMDEVIGMQEDKSGKIWLMGDNQIVRFDIKKNTAETFPKIKALIENEIFSEATKCRLANGQIVLGYSDGAIYFNPAHIPSFDFKPYLAITGFAVNNKELYEINPKNPKNPDLLKKVVLEHDQNFLRIQFAALDYIKNENVVYQYKLEGVDKEWNYIKGGQSINYTNLGRGKYTLLLSSTNSHNLWVNNQREIEITIRPSMWWTNFAFVCYFLIAIGLFILIRRIFLTIIKLRNDVQIEQELSELKLRFFTDISHEIRTPLTMITAPLEKMLSDKTISDSVKIQLQGIERNSNRLLNLVNQILDLRRIQNKRLEVSEINVVDFVSNVCENFREMSLQQKIRLELKIKASDLKVWADSDSLDKILVNLISNAFKYCHKNDVIKVIIGETDKHIFIKVKDNGPGISPVLQKRLFRRFSNYNENPNNPSTGIGLSIVKDLADKHKATILVDSEPNKGSCFQLYFLKGYEHFNHEADLVFQQTDKGSSEAAKSENKNILPVSVEMNKNKPSGLIVEDDPELRAFIVSVLESDYSIHIAENGIQGHLKATTLNPDFIISDVMMPQMDGIEMLKLIRNNIATSHIPVILLSAKSSVESKLEGMEYGADEYLTKPFELSYLKARVKNILEQRKRLQFLYSTGNITEIPIEKTLQISNQDHKFMFQVIKLVKDNISKTDFSVEELGKLMCMSRASFFNKLKDLTGVSPVVFIRDIRLNEAAEMLKKEDMLIKEICFEVGFNDLKYFGKCFKSKFNYTPAEYRRLYK